MKKQLLSFVVISLSVIAFQSASAQNYQPFSRNLTYHFTAQDSIYSLRIDSSYVLAGDSVFVFNKVHKFGPRPTTLPPNCYSHPHTHQIYPNNEFGQRMLKKANGDYQFITMQGAQFLLKTRAIVGQSWVFNVNSNLTATLSSKTIEPVLNTTDSVLTITLSNNKVIKLTKNYGFLKAPNFASISDSYFRPKELIFLALPERQLGKNYSSPLTIFDYQPGDIFHHHWDEFSAINGCMERYTRTEIISRSMNISGDSIFYQATRQILEKSKPNCDTGSFVLLPVDTISIIISQNDKSSVKALSKSYYIIQSPPGYSYSDGWLSYDFLKDPNFQNRVRHKVAYGSYYNCSRSFFNFEGGQRTSFVEGLGRVHHWHYGMMYQLYDILIGYKKDGIVHGNLQPLTQIMLGVSDNPPLQNSVYVFPNPTQNIINLKFDQPLTNGSVSVSILNTLGQVVLEQQFTEVPDQQVQLSLDNLSKGLYMVQVTHKGKIYSTRLVKQ